ALRGQTDEVVIRGAAIRRLSHLCGHKLNGAPHALSSRPTGLSKTMGTVTRSLGQSRPGLRSHALYHYHSSPTRQPLCQEISGRSQGETNEALKSFGLAGKNFPRSIDKPLPGTVV